MALNCSDVVAVAPPAVLAALEKLQAHALEKLAARSRYQSTGVATLRFKGPWPTAFSIGVVDGTNTS